MSKKHALLLLVFGGLLLLGAALAAAQTSDIIYIKLTDDTGGKDSLVFGPNVTATYNVDAALGENSSPPYPPGFSATFTATRGGNDWGLGLLKKDLRDTINAAGRKDTFQIRLSNGGTDDATYAANAQLTWPDAAYLAARCDSMFLAIIPTDPVDLPTNKLDMMTTNTFTLSTPYDPNGWNSAGNTLKLRIYVYHWHDNPWLDKVHKESSLTPSSFTLYQNYPNPFNPTTSMRFDVQKTGMTEIAVYNILGQKVSTLVSSTLTPGTYNVQWNGTNEHGLSVNSGVYFVHMSVSPEGQSGFSTVRKIMLMK